MLKQNKFRLFAFLLFAGAVNLILLNLYKEQFRRTLKSLPNFITRHWLKSNLTSIVRLPFRRAKTLTDVKPKSHILPAPAAKNRTGNFIRRELKAMGKTVWPRAHLTAPWDRKNNSAPLCPLIPPKLVGHLLTFTWAPNWTDISRLNPGLEPGGHYQPSQCQAWQRVAIIVPYRDRDEHLRVLLHNLHPMLIRQQLDYFILVVELAQPTRFNRGMLLNIGVVEAGGLWDVQCFILHDVDLVPENDRNFYTCPQRPRHMSAAVDKFGYRLPYQSILGGVTAITREHFYRINGYSNLYFGWGGEDDDLSIRVRKSGLNVTRYPMEIARYRMIKHVRDKNNEPNPKRYALLKNVGARQPTDGLNSLQYRVNKLEFRPAYTWIQVSIDEQQVMKTGNLSL